MAIYANSQHKGSLRALHIYTISPVVLIKHCSDFFRADFLAIYINSKKKNNYYIYKPNHETIWIVSFYMDIRRKFA